MPLSEAQSLARHTSATATLPAKPWKWLEYQSEIDLQQLKRLAAACDRFSPRVGREIPHDTSGWPPPQPTCLYLDGTSHYRLSPTLAERRERQLLTDVVDLFRQRGYYALTAMADTLGAAWGISHFAPSVPYANSATSGTSTASGYFVQNKQNLPELFPLPIEALRLKSNTIEILHCLGIETISQLWELPRSELPARFGPQLLERMDQAEGTLAETFSADHVTLPLFVELHLDRPTQRQDVLTPCVKQLLEKLTVILKQQNRCALRVVFDLEMEPSTPANRNSSPSSSPDGNPSHNNDNQRALTVGLFRPTQDADHLMRLFEIQLERLSLPTPVHYIAITVTVSVQPDRGRVQWLPGMEDAAPEKTTQSIASREITGFIENLSCRLGSQSILTARLTAEPQIEHAVQLAPLTGASNRRTAATPAALRRHQSTTSARPLRVFDPPLRIHSPPTALHQRKNAAGQSWKCVPQNIRFENRTYRIRQHWGPERIETSWWQGNLIRRDYFRLEDDQGGHWWVYYDLRKQDWFVHGAFD